MSIADRAEPPRDEEPPADEEPGSGRTTLRLASGASFNAIALDGGRASVRYASYALPEAKPPDPAAVAAAFARLAEMPTDVLPRPAPELPAASRVPRYGPNPHFVGRTDDLLTLARAFAYREDGGTGVAGAGTALQPVPTVIVTGIGGVGKTQLAVQFAHLYGQFFAGGVFWISCTEAGAVPGEIAACGGAGHMGLRPDFADLALDDQAALVMSAWRSAMPRLLVFDNCEDPELPARWRPAAGGCRLLVTSRRSVWDAVLGARVHPLQILTRPSSIELLRKHRPDLPADDPCLGDIAAEAGDLPLALHLAGSVLALYRHVEMPAEYLARLRSPALLDELVLPEGVAI